jgi:hypothetical protein
MAQDGRMNSAREYLLDLRKYPPEEALTRVICHELAVALVDHMDLNFAESQKRVQPFQTLALTLRQRLPLEIIHDVAASLSLFDPSPSEYERQLAEVQQWFLHELKSRFDKDLPEFLLLLGQMNRRFKIVSNPTKGLRILFPENQAVMDAYREACVDGDKIKPITVEDYFACGILAGEQARKKLLAILNAVPKTTRVLKLKQVEQQFKEQAVAHKQALKAFEAQTKRDHDLVNRGG